ncbi:ATP-dependent DNA helicase [uncultured Methanobacterium sp.]|jgi:DNA helicase-2/ATP-dependent DNA helicase PcrA|uniref:ATP-dependent helicase n=1 Tax=uncultured Methanobacterium sp. TaxID=176306 RepID=UPI0028047149|nr:ATP-dependent DNA helicase [uncultured Methanobacterium sp.]
MPAINLNQDQREAVKYFSRKPLLIQAGPGSGKTRVIIERVKYLIQEKNLDPETFLAVTFSNKASDELRERLTDSENGLDTETVNKIHISTIHSFCYDFISNQGFSYDILEEDEKNHMFIYKHLADLGFKYEKYFKRGHIGVLVNKFNEMTTFNVDIDGFEEYVKNEFPVHKEYLEYIKSIQDNLKEDEYFNFPEEDVKDSELFSTAWYNARYNQIAESYRRYLRLLEKENYIDFSLIQTRALELMDKDPDLVKELKFKNVLVDEFQDTDPVQMKIFDHLIKNADTFTAVGDDDQSIYGFRGSDIKFFREFQDNYDAHLITLKTNYRSTRNIVEFCENFIENDREIKKELESNQECTGGNPDIFYIKNGNNGKQDEADQIAGIIKHLKESGKIANYSDVGILFRALSGGKALKLSLTLEEHGIPYDIIGNEDLLDQAEVKVLLLMMYYLIESDDKPYILNRWSGQGEDWLNIYGFASKNHDLNKYFGFSQKTRDILIKLEEDFREKVIETEKEVYKEKTRESSRIRSYFGVFNKYKDKKELKEDCLNEIFERVNKPYLYKFTVDDLRALGIDDEHDLNFFKRLYDLRQKLEKEWSDKDNKDKTTLLDVFYELMSILDNFDFDDFDDGNKEKLLNVSILSNTIYKFEDVVSRHDLKRLFWFFYHNLGKQSSSQINNRNEVQIMTIHKSKGLEFPVVFIAGLKEKSFPRDFKDEEFELYGLYKTPNFPIPYKYLGYKDVLTLEEKEEQHYYEERRVLYVGLTRAKDVLILSTYENKDGRLPEIDGIDFNQIKRIEDDYSIIPPIQIDKIPDEEAETPVLSYTSIRDYEKCPFRYYIVHQLSYKESDTFKIKKGNISHKILDKIHINSIDNLTDETLTDETIHEVIDDIIPENDKELYQNEIKNIKKYLDTFYREVEVVKSEFPFTIKKDNYIINGQIDLIYRRNGVLGILDFKNKYAVNEEEIKNQLYTYLLALKLNPEFYNENVKELAVYLLKAPEDGKLLIFDIDEEYLNNFQNKIVNVAQNINNNVYPKKKSNDCDNCSFSFICK